MTRLVWLFVTTSMLMEWSGTILLAIIRRDLSVKTRKVGAVCQAEQSRAHTLDIIFVIVLVIVSDPDMIIAYRQGSQQPLILEAITNMLSQII